jgi:chaperonin cofactor prefoldin
MKTEIAGLVISYSTVADLNEKMQKALEKVVKTLNHMESRHKTLVKQKKRFRNFLGSLKNEIN